MGLVVCKDCANEVSKEAKSCPKCGAPVPQGTSPWTIAFVAIFGAAIFSMCSQDNKLSSQPATAPKTAQQIAAEKDFQTAVAGLKYLKEQSKNPSSFEVTSVLMINSKVLCIEYRARNSFNALVPGFYVFSDTVSSSSTAAWNKNCAGKSGENLIHARQAI